MSLLSMIPAQYRWAALGLSAAVLVSGAAWSTWWIQGLRLDLQEERGARLAADLQRERDTVTLQAGVLVAQQTQIGAITAIDERITLLEQRITRQAAEQRQAFMELTRNDPAIVVYLDQPVPAALGLHYARPETTDPAAYRAAAGLHPGPVPAARPAAAADK